MSGEQTDPENFREAMDQLEELASALESGELSLEEAMQSYSRGAELIKYCEEKLEEAELLVEEVDDQGGEQVELLPKEEPE